jgi:hypothetical protein
MFAMMIPEASFIGRPKKAQIPDRFDILIFQTFGRTKPDMKVPLSEREAAILLGATLMHWGVPFHSAAKRALTDDEQAIVDSASSRFIAWRDESQKPPGPTPRGVSLSDSEIHLLITVLEDCLAECGNDGTELSLQLKASSRQEVETLVSRLRRSLGPNGRNPVESRS